MNELQLQLDPAARARKINSLILQRLQEGTQAALATTLGLHESTISRFKSEHLEIFSRMVAHLGLKVVPANLKCYAPEQVDFMFQLFKSQVSRAKNADDLLKWDD